MKVILMQDIKGKGKKGQLIEVSEGYANNFLLQRKLAKKADAQAITEMKNAESSKQHKIETEKKLARSIADKLEGKSVTVFAKPGKDGKIFGSVTVKDISEKINSEYNIKVDKRKIKLDADIKAFGSYKIEIKLYAGISCTMYVSVKEIG